MKLVNEPPNPLSTSTLIFYTILAKFAEEFGTINGLDALLRLYT